MLAGYPAMNSPVKWKPKRAIWGVSKGERGRGPRGKIEVFGLLKRGGKVYMAIIPNVKTETLLQS